MIIHKLLLHHLWHRDDPAFYQLQASDALDWLARQQVRFAPSTRALDLGCGHGILGADLIRRGCDVWFADAEDALLPGIPRERFIRIDIDQEELSRLGRFDLVICSNVYEHLRRPREFLHAIPDILGAGGHLYLSWTNWLSPWGGHEFSPFHYLGPHRGHRAHDRIIGRPRIHTPFVNLFPTYIGMTLRHLGAEHRLQVIRMVPRYYPELAWLSRIPLLREFLTWNCAILLRRIQ